MGKLSSYSLRKKNKRGTMTPSFFSNDDVVRFQSGIHYSIYEKLGAHPIVWNGIAGTHFAVWAPNALGVSVVGDFNYWDGSMHPMKQVEKSGIFEIFVPGVSEGALYKFELLFEDGSTCMRQDPYAYGYEVPPCDASIVRNLGQYEWSDDSYMKNKENVQLYHSKMAICEIDLSKWSVKEDGTLASYGEIADKLLIFLEKYAFTHIELLPVMEYLDEESLGYHTSGYYAPTSRYGTAKEFMEFVDKMHQAGIGVILDWSPAHFDSDYAGMANYDGTCLYEHLNPLQGLHPLWGTHMFNHGRPQVKNFLIANALFWSRLYHVDGIRADGVSYMLRLDYQRPKDQWIPNIYGTNENLEGIEFMKHLNSIYKKELPQNMLIVQDDTNWPLLTGDVSEDCIGFDYKWNVHFTKDMMEFLCCSEEEQKEKYNNLSLSMWYNYMERYILSLSRGKEIYKKDDLIKQMHGTEKEKKALLRAAYAFMMTHPGKKLFHSEELFDETFFSDLLNLYKEHDALYELDYYLEGFEWINHHEEDNSIIAFVRKNENAQNAIVVVCNFSDENYYSYNIGVPFDGKYAEVLNTDAAAYGGSGFENTRMKMSKKEVCDERDYSISIKLPAHSVCVFSYSKDVDEIKDNQNAKKSGKTQKGVSLKEELTKKVNE